MKARNALSIYGSAGHSTRSHGTDLDGRCSCRDRRGEHPPPALLRRFQNAPLPHPQWGVFTFRSPSYRSGPCDPDRA